MKSRSKSRSSSRMSNVSTTSNISTANESSRIDSLFNDFNSRVSTPTTKTAGLLCPMRENTEYETLSRAIRTRRMRRKADMEAIKIQKTFRMYIIRRRFRSMITSYKSIRTKNVKLYYYTLLLNSTICSVDRRGIFNSILSSAMFSKKLFKGYEPATNEIFATTGFMAVPPIISGNKLVKFVRLVYASRMRKVLEEWRFASRKSRYISDSQQNFKMDRLSTIRFGNYYTCFALWLNFTRYKHKKELTSIEIPQWQNFMKERLRVQRQIDKADALHYKTIKENSIQALKNTVLSQRHDKHLYEQAIQYNIAKRMKFALSGWVKFLIIQQNKVVTMRFVFRRWFQAVQRRNHLLMLYESFTKRHEYYQKRNIVNILAKNRKVSKCLHMYQYLRIMQKPSLALYFVSLLRKDNYSESISHTFSAWISLVRRRRRWLHFVFMNEVTTEYSPKKRLYLAAMRRRALPTLTPICIYSGRFKKETMMMYQRVMSEKVDPDSIYLVVNGDTPDSIKKAAATSRTHIQQRDVFFKLWKTQKNDLSLLMRSAIVYCAKKNSQIIRESETISEQCYRQYKKVIAFLAEMNLASDGKFEAAQRAVNENNKRSLLNRKKCIHRDNLIILSHDSHHDAENLHDINEQFKTEKSFITPDKIKEATDFLASSFQPLITLTQLGSILEQPNESRFVHVIGCQTRQRSYKPTITDLHNKIYQDLVRSEIGHDVASRFDRLLAGRDNATAARNGAHSNSRCDPYSKFKGDYPPKSKQSTGINDKLLNRFPMKNRRAQIIRKETGVFNMPDIQETEEEETDETLSLKESSKSNLSFENSSNSMFYNGLNSLTSLMQNASMAVFNGLADKSHERLLANVEEEIRNSQRPEEEDNKEYATPRTPISQLEDAPIAATKVDYTLIDGFDKATMLSLKQAKEVQPPNASKKYQLFLEILFGRTTKEANNLQINNLRRKIISEYRNRKPSLASSGVETKGITRPVTGLLEQYRRDKQSGEGLLSSDSDDYCNHNRRPRDRAKDRPPIRPEDGESEFTQTYNSRRFKITPKKHGLFSRSGSSDDFREDLLDDDNRGKNIIDEIRANDVKDDEVFDDTLIDPAAIGKNKFVAKDDQFSTATPYTSLSLNGEDVLNKVNKVAIHLLKEQIKDDTGEGLLVEVDPAPMPGLDLGTIVDGMGKLNADDSNVIHGPGYKKRKFIKVPKPPSKRTVPIIIPDKLEMNPQMKKTLQEEDPFNKLIWNKGKAVYVKGKKSPQRKYFPPYKVEPENENDKKSNKGKFIDGQIVSFKGGKRQLGTDSTNFAELRIAQSKQHGLIKPLMNGNATLTCDVINKNGGPRSFSQLESRPMSFHVQSLVKEFVRLLASAQDNPEGFEAFRQRARLERKKPTFVGLDSKTAEVNKQLYETLQNIVSTYSQNGNFFDASNQLIRLANKHQVFAPVLVEAIDQANRYVKDQKLKSLKRSQIMESKENPDFSINYLDMSWMADMALSYNAVAIQYKEETDDHQNDLEAIVASTVPSKPSSKKRTRSDLQSSTRQWDDVLKSYNVGEMLLVTPYVIPEQVVDNVLDEYRKTLRFQMH